MSKYFYIIESDNNTLSPGEKERRKQAKLTSQMDESDGPVEDLAPEQFGLPLAGLGHWASCIRVLNAFDGTTLDLHELDHNEAAFRYVFFVLIFTHIVICFLANTMVLPV